MEEARHGNSIANGVSSVHPGVGVLGIEDVARMPTGRANMVESRMQEERRPRRRSAYPNFQGVLEAFQAQGQCSFPFLCVQTAFAR